MDNKEIDVKVNAINRLKIVICLNVERPMRK
jgi:hypothetical protein